MKDPISKLRTATRRAKSDVAKIVLDLGNRSPVELNTKPSEFP